MPIGSPSLRSSYCRLSFSDILRSNLSRCVLDGTSVGYTPSKQARQEIAASIVPRQADHVIYAEVAERIRSDYLGDLGYRMVARDQHIARIYIRSVIARI